MTTITYDCETVDDIASEYVVQVVVGENQERTNAVGLLTEDGELASTIQDPETIVVVALRLINIADEIRENRARDRLKLAGIVSIDDHRGPHGPSMDV